MVAKKPTRKEQKVAQITTDLYPENLELLNTLMEERNLSSRKDGFAVICKGFEEWLKGHSQEKTESEIAVETVREADLPYCVRRVPYPVEKEVAYLCACRRPCSPVHQTKLITLGTCLSCKAQEFQLPSKTQIGQETAQKEEEEAYKPDPAKTDEPEETAQPPQPVAPVKFPWAPPNAAHLKKAFSYNKDGSKNCPYSLNSVYITNECKHCEADKKEQCDMLYRSLNSLKQPSLRTRTT